MVRKGVNPDVDSYSAFWDNNKLSQTNLVSELTKRGVTDVYACGLAYDFCVGKSFFFLFYWYDKKRPFKIVEWSVHVEVEYSRHL